MKIAFLGTGLMGTGFVRRMLAQGHEVSVWNRSADKARALEAHGARAFATAAEAVRGVDRVHLMVADDAVVDAGVVVGPAEDLVHRQQVVCRVEPQGHPTQRGAYPQAGGIAAGAGEVAPEDLRRMLVYPQHVACCGVVPAVQNRTGNFAEPAPSDLHSTSKVTGSTLP